MEKLNKYTLDPMIMRKSYEQVASTFFNNGPIKSRKEATTLDFKEEMGHLLDSSSSEGDISTDLESHALLNWDDIDYSEDQNENMRFS